MCHSQSSLISGFEYLSRNLVFFSFNYFDRGKSAASDERPWNARNTQLNAVLDGHQESIKLSIHNAMQRAVTRTTHKFADDRNCEHKSDIMIITSKTN